MTSRSELTREQLLELNPHLQSLQNIEAGIPIDIPISKKENFLGTFWLRSASSQVSPYEVAKKELLIDVAEDSRPGRDNDRITLYHSTTSGGAAPDEIAWCSSFVNYCVEQTGLRGTDSKAARSWVDWGIAVDAGDWQEGDIVVFWRVSSSSWKGHVGFLVDWNGPKPTVLGGNQGSRLSIGTPYPFTNILAVRRQPR